VINIVDITRPQRVYQDNADVGSRACVWHDPMTAYPFLQVTVIGSGRSGTSGGCADTCVSGTER